MSSVGENIKKFRVASGLTQSDLGKKVGKAPSVIANWEAGTNRPDVDSIQKMLVVFGVDANGLFGWSDEKSDSPTPAAQRIAHAYDAAPLPIRNIVDTALEPYVDIKPLRIVAPPPRSI